MRRQVRQQQELQGETSQSDWSEEDEARELLGDTDHLSMAANGGLTDAEGALSGNTGPHRLDLEKKPERSYQSFTYRGAD